ncbi:MAG TPA: FAD-linked oxidase C-terminal domain-containing protein [Desulfosporosinus sp.]|nr:FAD-linked oxidase C-terminal domain-containing protein [Desulfosporosinus sp.]
MELKGTIKPTRKGVVILVRPNDLIKRLIDIVGKENLLFDIIDLESYAFDGSMYTGRPDVVALPENMEQVVQIVKVAGQNGVAILPRGAGTSLSGGAVPLFGGIVLGFSRMKRILEIDLDNERVIVEPGISNLDLQKMLKKYNYIFAPDPASMKVCTIGGNIAENAGGMHCLKYGNTRDHVLGLEIVMASGEVIYTGDLDNNYASPNLTTMFCGSEGTFGIITKAMLRLTRMTEKVGTLLAVFENLEDAGNAVSEILSKALVPTSLEILNDVITRSLIKYMNADLPSNGVATLLVEVEGYEVELEDQMAKVMASFTANNAITSRIARDQKERSKLWEARQGVNGIFGHLGSGQLVQDPSVPVDKIGQMMRETARIGEKYGLIICQTCHAGDGNLHPGIMYDANSKEQYTKAEEASDEILKIAISLGGSISGEHGIGIEKLRFMPLQFSENDLGFMESIKRILDPTLILNHGKILNLQSNI